MVVGQDLIVQKVDRARSLLAEARDAPTAKKVADLAHAAEVYAKRQKLGREAVDMAHAVVADAERLLGQFLKAGPTNKGAAAGGKKTGGSRSSYKEPRDDTPTRADLGLNKKESSTAKFLADVPEDVFERYRKREASVNTLRREAKRAQVVEAAPLPPDVFRVLYADPPWSYGDGLTEDYGGARFHYPSMSISALCALPVVELAADNAVLFLWVTSPLLGECWPVIKAWGFEYKASFVWDKIRHNFGHYNSVRHELLLICTRGSCLPDVKELIDSVQSIERTERHSEKPAEFRTIIETLYPKGRRLELFARGKHPGWDTWGNELGTEAKAVRAVS